MLKTLFDTEKIDVDSNTLGLKYYLGTVVEKRLTGLGHLFIGCTNSWKIVAINGVIRKIKKTNYEQTNFIIPKRRERSFLNASKYLELGKTYCFKLQQETRSKRYMVVEVFECP